MKLRMIYQCLVISACLALLTACGSSSGSSENDSNPAPTVQAHGTVVDPYIVGAVFQEVTVDGTILQRDSSPSDSAGNFTFPQTLTPGSIIEMKVGNRGFHNGAPYQGILRRKVEDNGGMMVVSPMTTLVANGATPEEVLDFLAASGLPGMTAADLLADPMAGLETLLPAQITDDQLRNLRAAMAVNAFLHILNDYRAGAAELATPVNRQLMADLVQAAQEALSASRFADLAGTLASDPELAAHPLLLGDAIRLAASCMQAVGDLADSGSMPSGTAIMNTVTDSMAVADQTARDYLLARIAQAPANGSELYDARCSVCHALGTYDASGFAPDLAGKDGLIAGKLQAGHQGIALTASETAALATFVADSAPTPTPEPSPSPEPAPAPTPVDGKTVYDGNCAACHLLGTYDASGFAPDLAGKSGLVGAKTAGGHGGGPLAADTLAALVAFIEDNTPATPSPAPPPSYSDCTACHGQPPAGTVFPDTVGAHAAHSALPGVGTNCAVCHAGATHNGWVDLGFAAAYNAKTGTAVDNGDGTCSNLSCHGGQRTPDWWTGTININTQCTSCHSSGTSQYNGYSSGRHSKHVGSEGLACTICHDTGKLAANHFSSLGTTTMEGPASATIGGGTTMVTSYNPSTRSCSTSGCHGSKTW